MKNKKTNVILIALLLISITFNIATFFYLMSIKVVDIPIEVAKNQSVYAPFMGHNIQAAHVPVNYRYSNLKLEVYDVMECERVTGSSMQPTHFTGNTVCIIAYKGQELKEGMMIKFNYKDKIIIHRIKAIYSDYVLTQGDNVAHWEKVDYRDITGIVALAIYT